MTVHLISCIHTKPCVAAGVYVEVGAGPQSDVQAGTYYNIQQLHTGSCHHFISCHAQSQEFKAPWGEGGVGTSCSQSYDWQGLPWQGRCCCSL